MRPDHVIKTLTVALLVLIALSLSWAAEGKDKSDASEKDVGDVLGRVFQMKVPDGFKLARSDQSGIVKWTKGQAEIYVVVGDLVSDTPGRLFKELLQSVEKNKKLEKVRKTKVRGGRAFVYTEKAPENPERTRTMRLVVISSHKVINVDFSAPSASFEQYEKDFRAALKSFKLL